MHPTSSNFLKSIRENWPILAFMVALIMAWTTLQNRVNNVEAAQIDQKADIKMIAQRASTLNDAIIEIKANYIFIKDSLNKLNEK